MRGVLAAAFALLCALLVAGPGLAQPPGAPPRPRPGPPRGQVPPQFRPAPPPPILGVEVATLPQPGGPHLAGKFYYLEDPSTRLRFSDVSSPEFVDRFELCTTDNLNLGFTSSVLWLRIDYSVHGPGRQDWMLTLDYPLLDNIDVFDGSSTSDEPVVHLGDHQPFEERIVPHRFFAVPLRGDSPHRRLYVRIQTESSLQVRPGLVSGRNLFLAGIREEFFYGLCYGVMVLMAVYNLFLFFQLRDKSYLLYVGSTLFGLLFLMCLNGHAFRYLWPDWPAVANKANPVLASLWVLTTAGFARLFLEPAGRAPGSASRVSHVLDGLLVLGAISTVLAFTVSYRPAMIFASGAALLDALLLLVCGIVVWMRGVRAARFFTLAWVGLGLGTINLAISRFGLMPDNGFTRNGALLGGIFEIVLLSLALSDKYRLMQVELAGYSQGLEQMVSDRTQQLETANLSLQRLATIDSLTGVSNRRDFEEHLEKEIRRHRRIAMPLSLAMIDIDHFKEFNDRHGHPRGDECLRRVAEAIASVARRPGDLVARYGGEEFAVLLPHTDRAGARWIGEGIRQAVAAIRVPGASGVEERVAVSLGLATRAADGKGTGARLVEAADRALYAAKRSGRDRMVQGEDVA